VQPGLDTHGSAATRRAPRGPHRHRGHAQRHVWNGSVWPTSTDERLAVYQSPTATQRLVGRALAGWWGCPFDDDHWVCIGTGRPVGDPVVAVTVEPALLAPFTHVQRERGDTLLMVDWRVPPPSPWFDQSNQSMTEPTI